MEAFQAGGDCVGEKTPFGGYHKNRNNKQQEREKQKKHNRASSIFNPMELYWLVLTLQLWLINLDKFPYLVASMMVSWSTRNK